MTKYDVHREFGSALKALKIVVKAETIKLDRKRVPLTSAHTGQRAQAKGEAFAYIDIPFQSVPSRLRKP